MVRTALRYALAVALLLGFAQLVHWLAVRRYFTHVAESVAPAARLSWDGIDAIPPGRVGLRGVRFTVAGRDELALDAERVMLRSDAPFALASWAAGWREQAPDPLALELRGVQASPALADQLRTRARAGFVLPFEAFGCGGAALEASEYEALGWSGARHDIDVRIHRDRGAGRLIAGMAVDRLPAGSLKLEVAFADVAERGLDLGADLGGARIDRISLDLKEQGTLAVRNNHCAAQDHSGDDEAFRAAHLRQLHAWLATYGLVPDEPVWAMYRQWLETGGPVEVVAEPAPGVALADYGQFAPEDRLRLLGVSARFAGGEPVPVEATTVRRPGAAFRPLPPLSELDPQQAFERMAAQDEPTQAADAVDIEAPRDDAGEGLPDDEPAAPAAPVERVTPAAAAAPDARPTTTRIAFPELSLYLGRRVRVETTGGNRHHGVVLDATADAVELEIRRYGGGARLPIARERISGIVLMPESDEP